MRRPAAMARVVKWKRKAARRIQFNALSCCCCCGQKLGLAIKRLEEVGFESRTVKIDTVHIAISSHSLTVVIDTIIR